MKKWSDKLNRLVKMAIAYRETHKIPEVGIEVVATTFGSNPLILQMKIDGENNLFEYDAGKLTLANKYGTLRQDITPLSQEFEKLMSQLGVEHLLGAGELYALGTKGEKLPLNEVMSIIKAPKTSDDESRITLGIFDLLEIDHKPIEGKYYERMLFANSLLGDGIKRVHTVFSTTGDVNVLKDLWEKNVLGPNRWEGLIVHSDGIFKVKYVGTIDALVVGAIPGEGKYAESLGSLVMGLMDKEGNILYCGKCGTGFNDVERDEWWSWVKKSHIGDTVIERDSVMMVQPERVIEVGYSFIASHPTPTLKWNGRNYVGTDDKVGGVLQTPRFYRIRVDKEFKYDDIRIEQLPIEGGEKVELSEEQQKKKLLEEKFRKIRKKAGLANPEGFMMEKNELWINDQLYELSKRQILLLKDSLYASLETYPFRSKKDYNLVKSMYDFVSEIVMDNPPNYSREWADASRYFVEYYPEYAPYINEEWYKLVNEIQEEFIMWYDEFKALPSYFGEREMENPKKWLREIKFLEKAQERGIMTPYLYDALTEIIEALKSGNIEHAANLTAVKSFICGTVTNLEHCPFGEDDKHNRRVLKDTLYGHLDGLHFELSMATDTIPSGTMIIGAGGIKERKLVGGSPTLDRIEEDRRRTYAEVEERMKGLEKENPSAIPSWFWMRGRVIPDVREQDV